MDPNCLTLTQDEFNAYTLRGVMGATGQPGETAQDTQMRCAAIVEMFRTFEPGDAMEAMIACHCIALRFMLDAAMRDANVADLDHALLIRLRASATAIGKNLRLWMADFERLHARNEARAEEARLPASPASSVTAAAATQPPATQKPPAQPGKPRPMPASPRQAAPPFAARFAGPDQPHLAALQSPVQSLKQTLLSSAAMALNAASNGRQAATPPPSGR